VPSEFKEFKTGDGIDTVDAGVLEVSNSASVPGDSTGTPVITYEAELIMSVSVVSDTAVTAIAHIYDCVINEVTKGDITPGENASISLSKTSLQKGLFTRGSILILSFYEIKAREGGNAGTIPSGFTDKLGRMWKLIKAEKPEQ
jgi:hypothetical protein